MAITRDQTGAVVIGTGTSLVVTWATNPTPGAKAFIQAGNTNGFTSVTDNGVTPATWVNDLFDTTAGVVSIWRADNITLPATGQWKVTVTFFAAGDNHAGGRTYLGMAPGGPLSSIVSGNGTSNSVNTGNLTPAATGDLLIGGFADDTGSATETITLTTSGAQSIFTQGNGNTGFAGGMADHIATTTSAQSLAWTLSDAPDWATVYAVYAPAASGNTSTGTTAMAARTFSGTVNIANPVTSTGSMHASPLGIGQVPVGFLTEAGGGLVAEDGSNLLPESTNVTSTGSFAQAHLAFNGTSAETITSTGSFHASPTAFSGTSVETFTSTGTMHVASPAFSGTATETFTSTGSMHVASPAFAGTVTETITSTGTMHTASPGFTGTSVETFTSTGTIAQAPLAFSGTVTVLNPAGTAQFSTTPLGMSGSVTVQNFFTATGSMALAPRAFTGTGTETDTSTGAAALATSTFSGTVAVANPVSATGAFQQSAMTFTAGSTQVISSTGTMGLAARTFTGSRLTFPSFGTIAIPGPSMSGTATIAYPTTGHAGMAALKVTGQVTVANPVTSTGHVGLAILGVAGSVLVIDDINATGSFRLGHQGMLGATGEAVHPTLTDYAAIADAAKVTVHVFVSDYAGAVDTPSGIEEGVAVAVPDYAAISETVAVHVTLGVHEYATAQEFPDGFNAPIPMATMMSTFTARVSMTSSLAQTDMAVLGAEDTPVGSTFTAGKPYQGNMRQIALARWNFMYPS